MNLETLLQNLDVDYKTRHRDVRANWIGIVCPYCGKPGEYYLGIHNESLAANCWRCGPRKTWEILRSFGATKQALAGLFRNRHATYGTNRESERSTGEYRPPKSVLLPDAPRIFQRYLKRRQLDPTEVAELWGVQAIPPPSKYEWRLLIPAFQYGRPFSWTTRSINDDCPHSIRYLSASSEQEMRPLRSSLYGADYCGHAIIVVEGPVDAWRIGPGAICTFGLSLSDRQIMEIGKYPVRVIAFDNETQAQRRAMKLCRRLLEGPGQTDIYNFQNNDAASSTDREIETLRRTFL